MWMDVYSEKEEDLTIGCVNDLVEGFTKVI